MSVLFSSSLDLLHVFSSADQADNCNNGTLRPQALWNIKSSKAGSWQYR